MKALASQASDRDVTMTPELDDAFQKVTEANRKVQAAVDRLTEIANERPIPPTDITVWKAVLDELDEARDKVNAAYKFFWEIRNRG